MMISVSDRIERERIDHANAEREIEAAERAEQEQIRAAWKTQTENDGTGLVVEALPIDRSGLFHRGVAKRKATNFDMSFFEEDEEGNEQSHIDSLKQQKSMFEKQRIELQKLCQATRIAGGTMFSRLAGKDSALKWVDELTNKYKPLSHSELASNMVAADRVSIDAEERCRVKLTLPNVTAKNKKKKYISVKLD
jgi:hypothetical protein